MEGRLPAPWGLQSPLNGRQTLYPTAAFREFTGPDASASPSAGAQAAFPNGSQGPVGGTTAHRTSAFATTSPQLRPPLGSPQRDASTRTFAGAAGSVEGLTHGNPWGTEQSPPRTMDAAAFVSALGATSQAEATMRSAFQLLGKSPPAVGACSAGGATGSSSENLIAQALNQALTGERKPIPRTR